MKASGYVEKHLGEGHAIIKDFNGVCWSTVGLNNIAEVEILPELLNNYITRDSLK